MKKILIILSLFGFFLFPNMAFGQQSNCLNFDGTNDYVDMETISPAGNFSTGFTFEAWVNWNAFNAGSRLLDIGIGTTENICISNQIADHGHLKVTVYNGTTESEIVAPDVLTLYVWQHVAVTIDDTGNTIIYINGNIVYSGNVFVPLNVIRNSCFIGKSNWGTDGYFDGEIDEVRIWNTVRTQAEITEYMHNPLTGNEAGLVAYYDFNQGEAGSQNGSEISLIDRTINENNGILNNFDLIGGTTSNWVVGHKNAMQLVFNTNLEAGTTITLPLYGATNIIVDWGDGNSDVYTTEGIEDHTYASEGEYTVTISGTLDHFGNTNTSIINNINKLTGVISFGELGISSLYCAFNGASNLTKVPQYLPPTITNLMQTFQNNSSFNQDINTWDVSNVSNMENMFWYATAFNQDLSTWNVSNVTNMTNMFTGVTLSTNNYSNMLAAWATQTLQISVSFDAGNSMYSSSAASDRQYIINTYLWTITDGGQSPDLDSLALVALYNSTNGAGWTNNTHWLETGHYLYEWSGVSVENGKVTELSLQSNNLVGTLPPEIGNLSDLTNLDLSNNQLSGSLPVEIENLSSLLSLNLSNNQFTNSLPDGIKNSVELTDLFLKSNSFNNLPVLSSLTSINNCSLDSNNFTFADLSKANILANSYYYAPQKDVTLNQTQFCVEKDSEFNLDIYSLSGGHVSNPNNTYQWYLNSVAITGATAATYIITAFSDADTGIYYCKILNTGFPELNNLKSQDISVKIADAGNDQAICENFATLSATDVGTYTGTWNLTPFGGGVIADVYTNTTEVTNLQEGENIFEWTVNTGISIYRDSISIFNNSVSALAGDDQIVYTSTTSLLADNPSQGLGFWTDIYTTTASIDNQNAYSTTVTNLQEGLTKFEWQVTLGDCAAKDTVNITYTIIPANAGQDTSICQDFFTMNANDVTGTWTQTTGTGNIETPTLYNTQITNLVLGNNTFRWTVEGGDFDEITITNNQVVADAGINQFIYKDSTFLEAINPLQGVGIWTDIYTTTAVIIEPSVFNTKVKNLQEGLTKFEWQVTLGDCMAKDTVNVTYTTTATANAGQDTIICNDFITMYANDVTGTWTQTAGTGNIETPTLYNTQITNLGLGNNTFRWTIENGDFDEITITNSSVTAFAGNDTTIYYTEYPIPMSELQLNATPVISPTTGTWTTTTGSGAYFNDATDPSTWIHDLPAGLNYLTWTVSNGNCVASDVVLVFSANHIHNEGDGTWNDPNTWIPAVVPSMYDSVVIANGTIEIIGNLAKFRFLRVSNGGLLIVAGSPAKATDGYLQGGHITIEQEIEKNNSSKALAQINVNTGGHITIEQEIEKSYGNNGIYVGSGGHITIEQEIEKSDTVADVSTPYLFVGTTIAGTAVSDATMFIGNRGHVTIEQEIEKGMTNQQPSSVVINGGGHITIEQEIEKGNPALLVRNGGHITIEQEIEKEIPKGDEAQLSIRGGHVTIEQEIEKGQKVQGNANLYVGTGGHVTIEQEIEKVQFVNSLLEVPKIKIKGGTITVGSTTPTRAGSATIRSGHITIEQEIEKRTNETPNLVLGNAGNIDFYHDAGNIEPTYMTVEEGCTFTIYEGGNIDLEVADKPLLFIQDGASVIDLSNNGVINGQTILSKNFIMNKIDLFASPIDILSSNAFDFGLLNSWNEQIWTIVTTGSNLNLVKGYKFVASIDSVAEYIGNLNNEELSIDLSNTDILSQNLRGWNLVGNPFPASLDVETIDLVDIENTFYIYNNTTNNFEVYQKGGICLNGADQYISPETGFFVKSALNANSPVFTVSSANTVHKISGLFKATEPKQMTNGIILSVSGTSYSDQTLVQFDDNSTFGFDNNVDAFKLFSLNTDIPQLFTRDNDNDMLSINTLQEPIYGENTIVDMNFVSGTDGTYSINVDDLNLANNITVLLKDKSNNETTNLREVSSYDFNYTVGESNDRFELIFGSSLDIDEIRNDGNINIYSFENSVYVSLSDNQRATVEIYNVLGVKIISQQISGVGSHKIIVNNIYNSLIVSVKTNSEFKTETIMITNK